MLDASFSIARVARIIRNDLYERRSALLVIGVAAMVVYSGCQLMIWNDIGHVGQPFGLLYAFLLWIYGIAFTSGSFSSSTDLRNGSFLMGLPASISEKFIARWLWTGPLYTMVFTLLIYLTNILFYPVLAFVLKRPVPLLPIAPLTIMESFAIYYVLHAVMLCGAVLFKRNPFAITMGIVGGAFFVTGIISTPIMGHDASLVFTPTRVTINADYSEVVRHHLHVAAGIFFYGVLMPLLWASAYLIFKDKEL